MGYFHDFDEVFSKSSWVNYCMCRIKMTIILECQIYNRKEYIVFIDINIQLLLVYIT
jgi:hypothetical protein